MWFTREKKGGFPPAIFKIINGALTAKSKGAFTLHAGRCYVLPHVYTMIINDAPEAKIDQAINLADDLQNALSKYGIYQNVTVRPFPLRVEVDRKDAVSIPLANYWRKMLDLSTNDGGFAPAVLYRGSKEILADIAFSNQANTHVGIFGTTGSGKTVMAQAALLTLAYRNSPARMGLVICDKTGKNFKEFASLPHLMMPIAKTKEECEAAVHSVRREMERRQAEGDESGYRIVLVVDEFTNLLDESDSIANDIQAIAQVGRNHNCNLMVIGQKMSVSVPTIISNNIGCRIVGRIADPADAKRTAGQQSQAHRLPAGKGAFEFNNGIVSTRVQGLWVDPKEIPQMMGDICQRWLGLVAPKLEAAQYTMPIGDTSPGKKSDPAFLAACAGADSARAIRKIYHDMFGKQLDHYDAVAILKGIQDAG